MNPHSIGDAPLMVKDESLESIKHAIRKAGLRATPTRIAILQMLLHSKSPQTHSVVAESLSDLGTDCATVFRSLNRMAQAGLLRRADLGDHVWRFEVIRNNSLDHDATHPHFLCIDCGNVVCLDQVKLTADSQRMTALIGEVTEILVRGHCNQCR
jgi:Fur family ferric uptake transcriptional regulator